DSRRLSRSLPSPFFAYGILLLQAACLGAPGASDSTGAAARPAVDDDAPQHVIVLDVRRPYHPAQWGAPMIPMTDMVAQEIVDDHVAFDVMEPNKAIVWLTSIDQPIDSVRYPIFVLRYKATRAFAPFNWYHLWFDDGRGPNGGGVTAVNLADVVGDGK